MKLILSSLACLALASCGGYGPVPAASRSEHLEFTTAGLGMEKGDSAKPFSFTATVKLRKASQKPTYATFRFDNPEQPSKPFVVKVGPPEDLAGEATFLAETAPFSRVGNHRDYSCSVDLYSDAARTHKIDHADQKFRVAVSPAIAGTLGVADNLD
jgi:hypothetical protein